jgi:hypothetical protein
MKRITISQPTKQGSKTDSFEKGRLFEGYIIGLFNERHFKLIKWQKSEKIIDGLFSFDHSDPDLQIVFNGKKNCRFAVECKWRKDFIEGKISWANSYQICSYEDFEYRNRVPVFIAIGIGGEPFQPERLFVTPLCNISKYTEVYEFDLIPYKRKPTNRFFYDTVQLKLF